VSPTRYGDPDPAPDDRRAGEPVPHECRKGWLSPPDADRPVPCLICRPHLAPDRRVRQLGQ